MQNVLYRFICPHCGRESYIEAYQYGFAERMVVHDIIDKTHLRHLEPEPAEGEFVSYYRCGLCRAKLCDTESQAAALIMQYAVEENPPLSGGKSAV